MQAAIQFFKDALRNEVKAAAFYNKAAEITQNDESRMLFYELAGKEDGHANILAEKAKNAPCGKAFDVGAFLDELADGTVPVISPEEAKIIETGSVREVLELAIRIEKKADETYDKLAQESSDPEVKSHCLEMAAEERRHVQELTNLLNSLDMPEDDRPGL